MFFSPPPPLHPLAVSIIVQVGTAHTYSSCQKKMYADFYAFLELQYLIFSWSFQMLKRKAAADSDCHLEIIRGGSWRLQLFISRLNLTSFSFHDPQSYFFSRIVSSYFFQPFTRHFFVLLTSIFVRHCVSFEVVRKPLIRYLVVGEYF